MRLLEIYKVPVSTYDSLKSKAIKVAPEATFIGQRGAKYVIIQKVDNQIAEVWMEDNVIYYYEKTPALLFKAI